MNSLTVIAANVEIPAKRRSFGRPERESQFRHLRHRKRFAMTTRFRKEKIRVIRQQLAEGTYELNEHLDTIVDSLFAVLTGPEMVSADHTSI